MNEVKEVVVVANGVEVLEPIVKKDEASEQEAPAKDQKPN